MRWKDFVPLRKKFKPGSKAWKRKRVKAYAVIAVFREASSNKPARLEIDFVRLGNTKTAAAIDKLSFKELTRISEEQAYTIPLKVISVVAARDLKEIRRSDKTRKIKFKKNAKKFGKLSGYFPIHAKRDSQKRLVWGGKNGTERAARVALKRLLSSREGAASVAHRKNPRR
jgi:hypothetical protein